MDKINDYNAGSLNILVADHQGNIGMKSIGVEPIRHHPLAGSRIQKGWLKSSDWQGFWAVKDLP